MARENREGATWALTIRAGINTFVPALTREEKMARKAEFKKRVEVTVYLEEWERTALTERLRDTQVTASGLLRHLLQCYLESDAIAQAPKADETVGMPASVLARRPAEPHHPRCPCVICANARGGSAKK